MSTFLPFTSVDLYVPVFSSAGPFAGSCCSTTSGSSFTFLSSAFSSSKISLRLCSPASGTYLPRRVLKSSCAFLSAVTFPTISLDGGSLSSASSSSSTFLRSASIFALPPGLILFIFSSSALMRKALGSFSKLKRSKSLRCTFLAPLKNSALIRSSESSNVFMLSCCCLLAASICFLIALILPFIKILISGEVLLFKACSATAKSCLSFVVLFAKKVGSLTRLSNLSCIAVVIFNASSVLNDSCLIFFCCARTAFISSIAALAYVLPAFCIFVSSPLLREEATSTLRLLR